jgi:hypothetical protein
MDPMWSVCGIRTKDLRMVHKHLQSRCMAQWRKDSRRAIETSTIAQQEAARADRAFLRLRKNHAADSGEGGQHGHTNIARVSSIPTARSTL